MGYCILSTVSNHNCTNACEMSIADRNGKETVEKIIGERVDRFSIKKLRNNATVPKRRSYGAARYDLSSAQDVVIPGRERVLRRLG